MARYNKQLPGLTVIVSTRKINSDYIQHIRNTSGLVNRIEILAQENTHGESLSILYNRLAETAKYDHIVFMHDDLIMETQGWGIKLLYHFQEKDYDIIGVAGVRKELPDTGRWWDDRANMVGIVNHVQEGKTHASTYSPDQGSDIVPVIILDGLFIACNWKTVINKWDESFPGFHFYDLGFTFPNYLDGNNIGVVTNIRITHRSIGMTNSKWEENRKLFISKYWEELPCKQ